MRQAVELFPAATRGDWIPTLEGMTGMSLETFRTRWRTRLGIADP